MKLNVYYLKPESSLQIRHFKDLMSRISIKQCRKWLLYYIEDIKDTGICVLNITDDVDVNKMQEEQDLKLNFTV